MHLQQEKVLMLFDAPWDLASGLSTHHHLLPAPKLKSTFKYTSLMSLT